MEQRADDCNNDDYWVDDAKGLESASDSKAFSTSIIPDEQCAAAAPLPSLSSKSLRISLFLEKRKRAGLLNVAGLGVDDFIFSYNPAEMWLLF